MIDLQQWDGYPQHKKVWGTEIWLINSPLYCAKLLIIAPGMQCSLHRHLIKTETFFILDGEVDVELGGHKMSKITGDSAHVPVGTWHRFGNSRLMNLPSIILEVSSHHDDADVERLDPSGPITQ